MRATSRGWSLGATLGAWGLLLAAITGCPRQGLPDYEVWSDDEGREIAVTTRGEVWTGYWIDTQICSETGEIRPRQRFRLLVDAEGNGVGTLGICRWGYSNCANGPAAAIFEATVRVDRIEGTVLDHDCGDYQGTEVLRRVRCRARPPSDYVESTPELEWREDSSRLDSGILVYRASRPHRLPGLGGVEAWAVSSVRGEVELVAATGVRVRASDGELHYGFAEGAEVLLVPGAKVEPGTRLARLPATAADGGGSGFELSVIGFTPELDRTDPHCVRGEAGR